MTRSTKALRRRVGTKGTQRDQVVFDPSHPIEELRATLRYVASASFETWIAPYEEEARAIATKAGLDPDKPGLDLSQPDDTDTGAIGRDLPRDYAVRILRLIEIVRGICSRDIPDAREIARYAVQLGYLICEARMKADADARYDQREAGRAGGKKNAGKMKAGAAELNKKRELKELLEAASNESSAEERKRRDDYMGTEYLRILDNRPSHMTPTDVKAFIGRTLSKHNKKWPNISGTQAVDVIDDWLEKHPAAKGS
jgi:hypothetical protein